MTIDITPRHAILTLVLTAAMSLGVYVTTMRTSLTAPPAGTRPIAMPPFFLVYSVAERGTFLYWQGWILLVLWMFVVNLITAVIILRLLDVVRGSEQRRR